MGIKTLLGVMVVFASLTALIIYYGIMPVVKDTERIIDYQAYQLNNIMPDSEKNEKQGWKNDLTLRRWYGSL